MGTGLPEDAVPAVQRAVKDADRLLVARISLGVIRLGRRLRFERPRNSMSPTQIAVLGHIHRWGAATPGEIAFAERLRPQSLTRVIAELEANGMITRSRDERDHRQYVLELAEVGRVALAEDMSSGDRWLAQAMGELTETERRVLYLAAELMDRLSGLP